jgi:hypothetical protein
MKRVRYATGALFAVVLLAAVLAGSADRAQRRPSRRPP